MFSLYNKLLKVLYSFSTYIKLSLSFETFLRYLLLMKSQKRMYNDIFELFWSLKFTNIFLQLQGIVSTVGYCDYDGSHHSSRQDDLLLGTYFTGI